MSVVSFYWAAWNKRGVISVVNFLIAFWKNKEKYTEDSNKTTFGILLNCMGIVARDLHDSSTILRHRQAWIYHLFPPDVLDSVIKMPGVK